MSTDILNLDLETAYTAVSETYKGKGDIHAACREMRGKSPIYVGDFIKQFGVPTNAGLKQGTRPTFALFGYKDVMNVLRDADTYTNGFIAEGLGAFFDGLIILAMDGEQHRRVRALLQPAFMPDTVNKWRGQIDHVIRKDFLEPMVPQKKAFNVIALWLGHESTNTTHRYVEANLEMKEKALARLEAPDIKLKRFRAGDELMRFLQTL